MMSVKYGLLFIIICGLWLFFLSPYSNFQSKDPLPSSREDTMTDQPEKTILPFPIKGKTLNDVISDYGESRDKGTRFHKGIDIAAPKGTPIVAVENGIITKVVNRGNGGKQIWLRGKKNTYYYAHLNGFKVTKGQTVSRGDIIGSVGNTGNASKARPHLHFGIYIGKNETVNPNKFFGS